MIARGSTRSRCAPPTRTRRLHVLLARAGHALRLVLVCLAGSACSEAESAPTLEPDATADEPEQRHVVTLAEAGRWSPTALQDDPFAAHRPDELDCGIAG